MLIVQMIFRMGKFGEKLIMCQTQGCYELDWIRLPVNSERFTSNRNDNHFTLTLNYKYVFLCVDLFIAVICK